MRIVLVLCAAVAMSLICSSCNVFTAMDNPQTPQQLIAVAMARANEGKCDEARDLLRSVAPPTNDSLIALGWAHLCLAGATAGRVAATIYKYTATTGDLTLLGALATELLPMDDGKLAYLDEAIATFNQMTDHRINNQLGIAHLVRASALLARQAVNQASTTGLNRDDITASTCDTYAPTCVGALAADCPSANRMVDNDVQSFLTNLTNASSHFAAAGVANLSDFAQRLVTAINGDYDVGRCFIRARVIPE